MRKKYKEEIDTIKTVCAIYFPLVGFVWILALILGRFA